MLTGLMTVRPPSATSRRRDIGLMLVALVLGVATMAAPESLASPAARALPVLLVLVVMFYWLWRLRSRVTPVRT